MIVKRQHPLVLLERAGKRGRTVIESQLAILTQSRHMCLLLPVLLPLLPSHMSSLNFPQLIFRCSSHLLIVPFKELRRGSQLSHCSNFTSLLVSTTTKLSVLRSNVLKYMQNQWKVKIHQLAIEIVG